MELRHLRYFIAVAEKLSFTHGAAAVHISQSTLSHQIKRLEEELGVTLFHRDGKRVMLSAGGDVFLRHARRALQEVEEGIRALREGAPKQREEFAIGVETGLFLLNFIPKCLSAFMVERPQCTVKVEQLPVGAAPDKVRSGELAFAVSDRPLDSSDLVFDPLYEEELALFVPPTHALARRKRVQAAEFHHQSMALLTRDRSVQDVFSQCCAEAGATPLVVAELNSLPALLGLVASANVGTILARHGDKEFKDLRAVRIDNPRPKRTIGLIRRKDVQPPLTVSALGAAMHRTLGATVGESRRWPYVRPCSAKAGGDSTEAAPA